MVRRRATQQRIVVVLEGIKSFLNSQSGVAPLSKAMYDVIGPEDQVLVLTLLYWDINEASLIPMCNEALIPSIKFFYKEIAQRREAYAKVFKPFYLTCQEYGVKFEVKIVAGFCPKDIVIEEANKAKANWILLDSCFAKDVSSFQVSRTKCNVISVNGSGEAIFHETNKAKHSNPNSLKLTKEPKPLGNSLCCTLPPLSEPSSPSLSPLYRPKEKLKMIVEPQTLIEASSTSAISNNSVIFSNPNFLLGLPLKLSKDEIDEITFRFSKRISSDENQLFVVFGGFFALYGSRVLVKMLRGDSGGIFLEAEKKAALCMRHVNILRLIGYYQCEDTTFMVFPFPERGTLDLNINGLVEKEFKLTFQDKLKIAIKTAQGLRYMHEECPRGPIVHGKLLLSNVFLGDDLNPLISGFGGATWLHLKNAWPIFLERYNSCEDSLDQAIMAQIKSDVLSFGVLLLRLFCGRSVPHDDETLIKWARPLLLERAFYLLLDKEDCESDDLDMHEVFRVMCTAFQCTMTMPHNRPSMTQVVSYLKGESFCFMQSSP